MRHQASLRPASTALFILATLLVSTACTRDIRGDYNCATDPASLGICPDLHPDAGKTLEEWACLDKECDDPTLELEFENGCNSISYLEGLKIGPDHACVITWAELAGAEHLDLAFLGFEGGLDHEIPDGVRAVDPAVEWTMAVDGPSQLRLGQFFEVRLTTNHWPMSGRAQMLLHVQGRPEGLLVDRPVGLAGASAAVPWSFTLPGRVGEDSGLVGGPYLIEVALMDDTGSVRGLAQWSVEIMYSLPVTCPEQSACQQRVCGAEPFCGEACGACLPGQVCTRDGFCEAAHAGACPTAADCGARVCGVDPVCGVPCGAACPMGQVCSVEGVCEVGDVGTSSTSTGGTGTTNETGMVDDSADMTGCYPDCHDRVCGLDPVCGWSCGECAEGIPCVDGKCDICEPDCEGVECGLDKNCGLICGTCGVGFQCDEGTCVEGGSEE